MNILFFSYFGFNPKNGGVERVSNILAEEFMKRGHKVFFITKLRGDEDGSYVPITEEVQLPDPNVIYNDRCADFFTEYVRKRDIDVIVCQHSHDWDHFSPHIAKERTGAKLLYAFHTTPLIRSLEIADTGRPVLPSEKRLSPEYRRIMRAIFKKQKQRSRNKKMGKHLEMIYEWGDGIVFLSPSYIDKALSITDIPNPDRLFAIGNPNTFTEAEIYECPKENTLLFMGRLANEKSPEKALVLWRRLQDRFPDWNLKIVGGGRLSADMENLKERWKLKRCFLEGRQEASQYYAKSKILLVTSDYEGFPMALVEGMQHGVVPVAFNSFGALEDIITDGVNGVAVTPYSLDEFENKLAALMEDQHRLSKMSAAAKIASKRYARSVIADQWLALFDKIGAGK